jgi:endonuclease/exonuclease/phosphatase family metal-dependent hydrolase
VGPPPLLLLATVLAFLVAPLVDQQASSADARPQTVVSLTSPRAVEPRVLHPQASDHDDRTGQAGRSERGVRPVQRAPYGVASFNMFRNLSSTRARADVRELTSRDDVDVVGWQEAETFTSVLQGIPGWRTATFGGSSELAISWRTSTFRLVRAHLLPGIDGVLPRYTSKPFGNREIAVVTLASRIDGRRLTVINVHLPPGVEDLPRGGRWASGVNAGRARTLLQEVKGRWHAAPSRWVVGTGDFNFDANADVRTRSAGGPLSALGSTATSSYQALGFKVPPTYPSDGRYIDYVWADRKAIRSGRITFVRQHTVRGLNSDHNALLVQLRLL